MYEYQIPVKILKALWTQMAKPPACHGCCAGDFGLGSVEWVVFRDSFLHFFFGDFLRMRSHGIHHL